MTTTSYSASQVTLLTNAEALGSDACATVAVAAQAAVAAAPVTKPRREMTFCMVLPFHCGPGPAERTTGLPKAAARLNVSNHASKQAASRT